MEKCWYIPSTKFHGSYVVRSGQTDNYDWANSQLSQFFFTEDHKTNDASSSQDAVCSVWYVFQRHLKISGTLQKHKGFLTSFSKHQSTKVLDGSAVKLHTFFTSREMHSHFKSVQVTLLKTLVKQLHLTEVER